jgi:hypothetical protein
MTPERLDFIFPFVVFAYGAVMTLLLHTPYFMELSERRLPSPITQQIKGHRGLGLLCLIGGALWTLQNLWL